MTIYVYRPNHPQATPHGFVPKHMAGAPESKAADTVQRPFVWRDMAPYMSPVTDTIVDGRVEHREHLARNNLIEAGNEKVRPKERDPLPPIRDSVEQAQEKLNQGYKPRAESISDWNDVKAG